MVHDGSSYVVLIGPHCTCAETAAAKVAWLQWAVLYGWEASPHQDICPKHTAATITTTTRTKRHHYKDKTIIIIQEGKYQCAHALC